MRNISKYLLAAGAAFALAFTSASTAFADDHEIIEEVMKKYHKAPKGTDPTCKKASNGEASKEELAALVKAYTAMAATKAPHGDQASWKEKNAKLLAAAKDLQAGKPGAVDAYKAAVNCKACHDVHKPKN